MIVRDTARTYPANKTSSNARALEDVKKDMDWEKQTIRNLRESIEDYDNGWADDFEDNPRKRARMEQRLETAKESYAKLKTEYESHPDYYADKYKDASGFEKALTGILGSTIATVPVVAETTAAALKEAEKKGSAEDYTSALQAEKIAWNKMNDYASSYFGSFDMIDQDELDRLTQEYQKASDYRKSLEAKYEQPVGMDSWGMNLMKESAWLKNSATENLDGFGKAVADFGIDLGQGIALAPLFLAGGGAYTAGVAANAAAEDMFEQTAAGKAASKALGSGVLTAGVEVASGKISDVKNKALQDATKDIAAGTKWIIREKRPPTEIAEIIKYNPTLKKNLEQGIRREAEREAALQLIDHLADELWRAPEDELDWGDPAQSAAENISSRFLEKREEKIAKEIKRFWDTLG